MDFRTRGLECRTESCQKPSCPSVSSMNLFPKENEELAIALSSEDARKGIDFAAQLVFHTN